MSNHCERCRRPLKTAPVFQFQGTGGLRLRCLACALTHGPMLRRSLGIALLVGSALVAINQGDVLLAGRWPPALAWKLPLTYMVPFVVATWAALSTSRVR
jgi:hypothetical protein